MGRVVDLDELEQLIAPTALAVVRWRSPTLFDLLHVGHIRYLQGAAAEADRLIVAINADQSVAALKGEERPVLPAADRAAIVAALRGVDT